MKVRNILFLVLVSLLLCTAVSAAEYTDVSDTHWAYKQIDYLSAEITGYPDGSYKPEKSVSRAEFLTLFARIAFPDEWKRVEGEEWWKSAYEVCTAHDLLNNITGSRSEAMPRGEIAALLERFCSGWGGVHERADAAEQYVINWKEQRMEFPEWQPLFPDAAEYWSSVLISANQGLLTGYPDGSFKPGKGVTRAEAATILARLKAQLVLREKKGCEYVCSRRARQGWCARHSVPGFPASSLLRRRGNMRPSNNMPVSAWYRPSSGNRAYCRYTSRNQAQARPRSARAYCRCVYKGPRVPRHIYRRIRSAGGRTRHTR